MSRIDYSKLRSLKASKLISALRTDGFALIRQAGSHQQYRHADGRQVTVRFHHSSDGFSPGILQIMIDQQAQWTEDDLKRLGLAKQN